MEELRSLVVRAQAGDIEAYGAVVRRFQDMACGYAHTVLGDFHLAEDAAQEAFVEAYRALGKLREPAAFPGWFRRIVFKHCDRLTRRKRAPTVPLETACDVPSDGTDPSGMAEAGEMRDKVLEAIGSLPDHEREATTLFYINGYSQEEVADFLEVPVTTVKSRLHRSRNRLKERMLTMVSDTLREAAPDDRFSQEVIAELLGLPKPLEIEGHPVKEICATICAALPHYEYVEGDEVVAKHDANGVYPSGEQLYHLDEERVLRRDTTIITVRAASGRTPPVRLITAGRTFRPGPLPQKSRHQSLRAFHMLDVLCIDAAVDRVMMEDTGRRIVEAVLGSVEWKCEDYEPFPYFKECVCISVKHGARWLETVAGGLMSAGLLERAGFDPQTVNGFGIGVGLERFAMLKLGLDDIRTLWEPPFVPKR